MQHVLTSWKSQDNLSFFVRHRLQATRAKPVKQFKNWTSNNNDNSLSCHSQRDGTVTNREEKDCNLKTEIDFDEPVASPGVTNDNVRRDVVSVTIKRTAVRLVGFQLDQRRVVYVAKTADDKQEAFWCDVNIIPDEHNSSDFFLQIIKRIICRIITN